MRQDYSVLTYKQEHLLTSGFRRKVDETCALLGNYAILTDVSGQLKFLTLEDVPERLSQNVGKNGHYTPVGKNGHYTLSNSP